MNKEELEIRILSYFNGELSDHDCRDLEEWINSSSEHKKTYERLMQDYQKISWVTKEKSVDMLKGKKLIHRKIRRRSIRKQWLTMAASFALLLTCGCIYYFYDFSSQKNLKQTQYITAGKSMAKLVKHTGEVVDLQDVHKLVQTYDGAIIKFSAGDNNSVDTLNHAVTAKEEDSWNKIIVPRGGEFFVSLCDGTNIWLNSDSELEYPNKYKDDYRNVRLKGEAFFEVKSESDRPFIVESGDYTLKVYGTKFNLNTYDPEKIEAALVSGNIGFKVNGKTEEIKLEPSQLGTTNINTGETSVREVDLYPYVAWRNNELVFINESLESIMEKVARWYDVEVFFQKEELKNVCFYGNMKRYAEIQDLLSFLEKISDVHFNVKNKTITISYK